MVALTRSKSVWTLDLGADENCFSQTWLEEVEQALDQIEFATEPAVLVTSGSGKFYSNGLDLAWIGQHFDELDAYLGRVQSLFARVLTLPVPTMAAINGHAFGAGAMFAMAHDWRVMREDRGYFCFPEVDINAPFTLGMTALIKAKLSPHTAVDAMTTGRRFGAAEALASGLIDDVSSLEKLPDLAAGRVQRLAGKDRATLGTIKRRMFTDAVLALRSSEVGA